MTEPSRAVLAVHQESRKLALTWFPDTLPICDPAGEVRFNRKRDIVQITAGYHEQGLRIDEEPFQAEFCAKIINIAIKITHCNSPAYPDEDFHPGTDYTKCGIDLELLQRFSNVQNVFCIIDMLSIPEDGGDAWLGTDHCHWSRVCDVEDDIYFCWHDPDTPCSREGACAPLRQGGLCELLTSKDDDESDNEGQFTIPLPSSRPIYKWPMIRVDVSRADIPQPDNSPGRSGLSLQALFKGKEYPDYLDDSSDNEYESDGIDDLPIDDPRTEDEDDMGSGIEDDTLAMELLSGNRRHDDDESGEDDFDSDSDVVETGPFGGSSYIARGYVAGRLGFSPPEGSSDSDDSAPRSPSKRKNARRIVMDDSDEEEEGGSAANSAGAAATRGVKRRRIISDDDDEEDEDDSGRPQKRRHRDSSSSSDSSLPSSESAVSVSSASVIFDSGPQGANLAQDAGRPTVISSDSRGEPAVRSRPKLRAGVIEDDDSDEEEEESDDDAPPKTLSLAERLKMHRQANPVSSASEDDSDEEDSGLRYGEGESESEEENSMLDNMAEDGSDGEEEDDDDGY